MDELEFDFSEYRTRKRHNYLYRLGVPAEMTKMLSAENHLEEEGIEEQEIHRSVSKNHSIEFEMQAMINDFRKTEEWDEFGQDA